jgi:hypothetical protein
MHFFSFLTNTKGNNKDKQALGHIVALPFTLKKYRKEKE